MNKAAQDETQRNIVLAHVKLYVHGSKHYIARDNSSITYDAKTMRDEPSFQMMKQPKKRQYLYNVSAVATVYNKQDEKNGSKEE